MVHNRRTSSILNHILRDLVTNYNRLLGEATKFLPHLSIVTRKPPVWENCDCSAVLRLSPGRAISSQLVALAHRIWAALSQSPGGAQSRKRDSDEPETKDERVRWSTSTLW
jgi:hypothetical protein